MAAARGDGEMALVDDDAVELLAIYEPVGIVEETLYACGLDWANVLIAKEQLII